MENEELITEIKRLKDLFNLYRFQNNVLQNYNCEFQPQLDEMIERFNS